MIQEFITIVESLGITLFEFTELSIVFYIWSKPIGYLINKLFKGGHI